MSWVYVRSEPQLWTVGFYSPDDEWISDSDHGSRGEAADRVRWLNGGCDCSDELNTLRERLNEMPGAL